MNRQLGDFRGSCFNKKQCDIGMEVRNYRQGQGAGGFPMVLREVREVWNWVIRPDMACAGLLARPGTEQRDLFSFACTNTVLALIGYVVAARERGTPACVHLTRPSKYLVGEARLTG